jgi:hypothetical protein
MPPKPAESAASSALPPALDDLEAELKLKHSRKGVADDATTADASAARDVAGHDDGSSAVAQALAASGFKNPNPLFFIYCCILEPSAQSLSSSTFRVIPPLTAPSGIILCGECKGVGKVTQEYAARAS